MPELFKFIFTDLKLTKSDKVEIENIIILFVFDECSQKLNDSSKRIGSSGDFQHIIIKTLDTKTIS